MHRIGQGFDRHRLAAGRPLRIGGLAIASDLGPVSHSDGDVLLHALVNALLGAIGGSDIGALFPDTDPRWRGTDSARFVADAMDRIRKAGFRVANLDATVLLERPKLADRRIEMQQRLATLLEVTPDRVNVKFGTGEGVGAVGRREAVDAHAVVLLERALQT